MKKLYYKINFKLDGSKLGGSKFPNPLRSQYHIFEKPKPGSSTGCALCIKQFFLFNFYLKYALESQLDEVFNKKAI